MSCSAQPPSVGGVAGVLVGGCGPTAISVELSGSGVRRATAAPPVAAACKSWRDFAARDPGLDVGVPAPIDGPLEEGLAREPGRACDEGLDLGEPSSSPALLPLRHGPHAPNPGASASL